MNIIIKSIFSIFLFLGIIGAISTNFLPGDHPVVVNSKYFKDKPNVDNGIEAYDQDPELDGQSIYAGPNQPNVSWIADIGGWGTEAVYGDDGTAYLGRFKMNSIKGHVIALNPDGTKKWAFNITEQPNSECNLLPEPLTEEFETRCQPIESEVVSLARSKEGIIFAGLSLPESGDLTKPRDLSKSRFIVAINQDGSEKWRFDLGPEDVISRIFIGDNRAMYFVAGTKNGLKHIYSLNSINGDILWKKEYKAQNINGPSIGKGGILYFGGDKVMAIDSVFGTPIWEYETKTPGAFPFGPAVGPDGTIYVTSVSDFNLHAINPDGTLKWKFNVGFAELIPAIDKDGSIYVHTWEDILGLSKGDEKVEAGLHAFYSDGTLKWSKPGFFQLTENELNDEDIKLSGRKYGGSDSSIIIDKNGILYFGSDFGRIYAVDSKDGTTIFEAKFRGEFDNRPIITPDGTLVVCHHGGAGLYEGPRCIGLNDNGKMKPSPGTPIEDDGDGESVDSCFDICIDVQGGTASQCLSQCEGGKKPSTNLINNSIDNACFSRCLSTGESNVECNELCGSPVTKKESNENTSKSPSVSGYAQCFDVCIDIENKTPSECNLKCEE